MKKYIVPYLALITILISCDKAKEPKQKVGATKKSYFVTNKMGYQNQLPLYTAIAANSNTDFSINNKIGEKIADQSLNYEVFEKMLTPQLNIADKQYLIYIILAKKDFIGYVNANKNSETAVKKLQDYITTLIDSKYIGYCVLYNALKALPEDLHPFASEKFAAITAYSQNDEISLAMARNSNIAIGNSSEKQIIIQSKFKENLVYLERIKSELQ